MASGTTMFPWPNRIRDARWQWRGEVHQLRVSEPERATANHGLVRTRRFDVTAHSDESVTLSTTVMGEPGFPFAVRFSVTYTALAAGVAVTYRALNIGDRDAPVAVGAHPYLRIGDSTADDTVLHVPARTLLELDDRLLPVAERAVAGSINEPHRLGVRGRQLNHCYGDFASVDGGGFIHRLSAPNGQTLELRTDDRFRWLQVYTCDSFIRDGRTVRAIALEPMTAPPDAFNSQRDVATVAPGDEWQATWSIVLV